MYFLLLLCFEEWGHPSPSFVAKSRRQTEFKSKSNCPLPPPPLSIKIATRWLTCDDKQEQSTEIPWRTLNEFQFTIQSQKGKEKENNGLDAYFTYKNKTKNRKKKIITRKKPTKSIRNDCFPIKSNTTAMIWWYQFKTVRIVLCHSHPPV